MPTDTETAYAKINLALHVRRRREDGYHDIETMFAFAKHGDQLQASLADTLHFTIDGPFGSSLSADDDNLVMQAANRLRTHFSITDGASIRLTKNLPIASGIGGGSADAAAAARLLNRLWDIQASEQELADILAPLGADIPACVFSHTSFGAEPVQRLNCAMTAMCLRGIYCWSTRFSRYRQPPFSRHGTATTRDQWRGATSGKRRYRDETTLNPSRRPSVPSLQTF